MTKLQAVHNNLNQLIVHKKERSELLYELIKQRLDKSLEEYLSELNLLYREIENSNISNLRLLKKLLRR